MLKNRQRAENCPVIQPVIKTLNKNLPQQQKSDPPDKILNKHPSQGTE